MYIAIFYIALGPFMGPLAQIILGTAVFLPLVARLSDDLVLFLPNWICGDSAY